MGGGLNATAKDSYIVKNIETAWSDADLGFVWNDAVWFRSYWGKSYNYGKQEKLKAIFPEWDLGWE